MPETPEGVRVPPGVWVPGMELPKETDHFTFRCKVCGRIERAREPMEPLCTGPTWLDEHEGTMMDRIATHPARGRI